MGALRKKYLLSVLDARFVEPAEKYDDWGHLRCNSADHRNGGKHVKPRKRLRERDLVNQEFIVKRPVGYKPKYLPKTRTVRFVPEPQPIEDIIETQGLSPNVKSELQKALEEK